MITGAPWLVSNQIIHEDLNILPISLPDLFQPTPPPASNSVIEQKIKKALAIINTYCYLLINKFLFCKIRKMAES